MQQLKSRIRLAQNLRHPKIFNITNEIVLYQPNDQLSLEVKVENDTVWLNRNQMAVLFDRDVKTIGKHINNALHEELAPVVAKYAPTQKHTGPNFPPVSVA